MSLNFCVFFFVVSWSMCVSEMTLKQLSARVSRPKPAQTSTTCCVLDKSGVSLSA